MRNILAYSLFDYGKPLLVDGLKQGALCFAIEVGSGVKTVLDNKGTVLHEVSITK